VRRTVRLGDEPRPSNPVDAKVLPVTGNSLLASVVVSSVGMGLFIYGKKQKRMPHLAVGVVLMVYTYFVPGVLLIFLIAAVLLLLLYVASYLGL
jgi:ABC-type Na+ efflux pump permease subunit